MKQTILITGGHISPAVALIQELRRRGGYAVHFIGRRYAFAEAKERRSFEYEIVTRLSIPFTDLESPRFPSGISFASFVFPFLLSGKIIAARAILKRIRPEAVISFGGYISAPVVLAAWLLHIPVIMHEQTMLPGRANRMLSRFALFMCISWEESRKYFSESVQKRCILTGLPVRDEVRSLVEKKDTNKKTQKKLIYITGGSSGAHRINSLVLDALPELLKRYEIVHQCGDSQFHDYEMLTQKRDTLPAELKKRYRVYKYIAVEQIASILHQADIMVGRSGANTIIEIALIGKPAILIPLPESAFDEQKKQADLLEQKGSAIVCDQQTLTADRLINSIDNLFKQLKKYQLYAQLYAHTEEISHHYMAHARLADIVVDCIRGRRNLVSKSA
ncbi:MAG: UDP-N-acetylglucosamine--N-acetylmuramyl-(pentapeptide) pyrophosphoryl-undecaprenol N-acetylglucosamine transferase [Candidatus Roizmanbacteria bacterium]|nr:UDP-N-acetylglucosamine--N-acetylmuramyl-(pentapeptide) pyrophosphoryl-undecaprenol N-acetylglucosamine transferase [Candidatus Roizmanbacteria bacterium]